MSRWALPASLLGSIALAVAVLALVLGRDEVPTATYLAYTSQAQPLPRDGIVETPSGERVRLRFEVVTDDAEVAVRLADVRGLVLDSGTYAAFERDLLQQWRFDGTVLVVYGVDAAQVAVELEVEPKETPASGAVNSFVLMSGTDSLIGDPSRIDRTRPFVGVTYRSPKLPEGSDLGTLGWFEAGDEALGPWLARLAETSRLDYSPPAR